MGSRESDLFRHATAAGLPEPPIYMRMVDDGFFVYEGTEAHLNAFISLLRQMDPQRALEVEVSPEKATWMDLVIYKGPESL